MIASHILGGAGGGNHQSLGRAVHPRAVQVKIGTHAIKIARAVKHRSALPNAMIGGLHHSHIAVMPAPVPKGADGFAEGHVFLLHCGDLSVAAGHWKGACPLPGGFAAPDHRLSAVFAAEKGPLTRDRIRGRNPGLDCPAAGTGAGTRGEVVQLPAMKTARPVNRFQGSRLAIA